MCQWKSDWSHQDPLLINEKEECIDSCIWHLVAVLNDSGFRTVASCCGHGKRPGNIVLIDGRELIIAGNYKEARKIDKLFPLGITDAEAR